MTFRVLTVAVVVVVDPLTYPYIYECNTYTGAAPSRVYHSIYHICTCSDRTQHNSTTTIVHHVIVIIPRPPRR